MCPVALLNTRVALQLGINLALTGTAHEDKQRNRNFSQFGGQTITDTDFSIQTRSRKLSSILA